MMKDKDSIEKLGDTEQMVASKEEAVKAMYRYDGDLKNLDDDTKVDIKATRDRVTGIIKALSSFFSLPKSNQDLIKRLEFELEGARAVRKLD